MGESGCGPVCSGVSEAPLTGPTHRSLILSAGPGTLEGASLVPRQPAPETGRGASSPDFSALASETSCWGSTRRQRMTQGALGSLRDPALGWPGPQAGLAARQAAVAGPAIRGSPGHQEQQLRLFACKCEKPTHPSWLGKVRGFTGKGQNSQLRWCHGASRGAGPALSTHLPCFLPPDKPPCPEPRCLPDL